MHAYTHNSLKVEKYIQCESLLSVSFMLFICSFEMFSCIFDVVLFHTNVIVVTVGFERVGGHCLGWGIYLFFAFISLSNDIFVEIIVCFISS